MQTRIQLELLQTGLIVDMNVQRFRTCLLEPKMYKNLAFALKQRTYSIHDKDNGQTYWYQDES